MVFSSAIFLFYFLPVFLVIYHVAGHNHKNLLALLASLFFYSWGGPTFIFIVLASMIVDFGIVRLMQNYDKQSRRKLLISASVVLNIGLLAYFKYANFFVENVNLLLESMGVQALEWIEVALPIGISFFTFQKLSYSVDVYQRRHKPLNSIVDYMLFVLLFPQLIAGPIVRYNEIADQLTNRTANYTHHMRFSGMLRFCIGLAKKLLIANTLGKQVDVVFAMEAAEISTGMAWVAIVAYSFQIYFDFSGYSDMAIGIGRMMGFKFPENFNNPYISRNITEFWRRWHITLGRWMRDYLYIPLGGNRVNSKARLYFNLAVVFVISGFWHGAAWTFIIWGAWHGLFLIFDRIFLIKFTDRIGKIPSIALTYFIVLLGWVVFRAESFGFAIDYIGRMFAFDGKDFVLYLDNKFWFWLLGGAVFAFLTITAVGRKIEQFFFEKEHTRKEVFPVFAVCIILLLFSSASIALGGFNPFIYFRF